MIRNKSFKINKVLKSDINMEPGKKWFNITNIISKGMNKILKYNDICVKLVDYYNKELLKVMIYTLQKWLNIAKLLLNYK